MSILSAIVLGLIQGVTEFVPVSSSGHMVLVPWLLGWEPATVVFDTVVHWGTLVALLAYFWRDWQALIVAWVRGLIRWDWNDPEARLMWLLILATIPAVLLGFFLESFFESLFAKPLWVSVFLLVTAAWLAAAEWFGKRARTAHDLRWPDALAVGAAQAVAIAPGISRSGATISTGLLRGLNRADAARFSFLLATPVVLGAGALQLLQLAAEPYPPVELTALVIGFVVSAVSGYLCIRFLLRYLQRHGLYPFSIYCLWVGLSCLVVSWLG